MCILESSSKSLRQNHPFWTENRTNRRHRQCKASAYIWEGTIYGYFTLCIISKCVFPTLPFTIGGCYFLSNLPSLLSCFAVGCCVFTDNIRHPLTKYQWVTNIIRKNGACSKGFQFFSLPFIYIVLWSYMCPLDMKQDFEFYRMIKVRH